ncbi:hypothetical protein BC830DRAFT_1141041 [Chytriomyces sp. MP71]|nr:hypothetical protein BC830DRAFT_1141041 [Chytriomyces sp. MP71]
MFAAAAYLVLASLSATGVSAAFTDCTSWKAYCAGATIPTTCVGLTPLCFNPSPNVACAGDAPFSFVLRSRPGVQAPNPESTACRCIGGPQAGQLQGGTVELGLSDVTCQQFFSTNSTPTALVDAPLLSSASAGAGIGAAASSAPASKVPTSKTVAPVASANSNSDSGVLSTHVNAGLAIAIVASFVLAL